MIASARQSPKILNAAGVPFRDGYDAVEDKGRRRVATGVLRSEDKELQPAGRRDMLANARDLWRNFAIAAWAIRKHLDYVATFSFQSRNNDKALDSRVEELVGWWSRRANFDVARRHSLRRFTRMLEARKTTDGDVFALKHASGRVQGVEGDRVRTPHGLPPGVAADELTHGVQVDRYGAARAYSVCRRRKWGGFEFDRMVSSRHMLQHAAWEPCRFDQVRGVTPLSSAMNNLRDTKDVVEYAVAKAKVAQLFGLVIYSDGDDSVGNHSIVESGASTASDTDETEDKYVVDMGKGPFKLELQGRDRAAWLSNPVGSSDLAVFLKSVIMIALKSLDIPYSFFDESHTNYSGQRQAWLQYDQSAGEKRKDLQEILDPLLAWRLGLWIRDGLLELPEGMTLGQLRWEWVPKGIPWIDPLKEIKAFIAALDAKLMSRQRILKAWGEDWWEVVDEIDAEEERLGIKQTEGANANAA